MTEPPTTKPELIQLINERWDALQVLMAGLTAEQLDAPLGDGWSAKVHLAHIAGWETSLMALLRKQDRAAAMGIPKEVWAGHDTDAMNAVLARRAKDQSAAEVFSESQATHVELLSLLDSMTQEDLEKPFSHYQPDDPPYNANPVGGWVHGNTWDHYNEHIGWLRQGINER